MEIAFWLNDAYPQTQTQFPHTPMSESETTKENETRGKINENPSSNSVKYFVLSLYLSLYLLARNDG